MENKILNSLSEVGLEKIQNRDIFHEDGDVAKKEQPVVKPASDKKETDYLYEKTYVCPICNVTFKALTVKKIKPRLIDTEPDMRPVYQVLDITKYDAVACEKCGYAALGKHFDEISEMQIKFIKAEIVPLFKGMRHAEHKYTYDEAILRFQMALANAMVKHGRSSEKAYICLKLAWLYRGKRNELIAPGEKRSKELYDAEIQYIKKAREGFKEAQLKEMFPIEGMDEWTFDFLMAELSISCNEYDEAKQYISKIIFSKSAPSRVKEKARDLKDYLNSL